MKKIAGPKIDAANGSTDETPSPAGRPPAAGSTNLQSFFRQFLEQLSEVLKATAGAAWIFESRDDLSFVAGYEFDEEQLFVDEERRLSHRQFVALAATAGQCRFIEPGRPIGGNQAANDTGSTVVIAPLNNLGLIAGTLEFFLHPDATVEDRLQAVQIAARSRSAAEQFLLKHRFDEHRRLQEEVEVAERFSLRVHDSLEIDPTAYTVANELGNVLQCDRVSVAVYRRKRCRVAAISGQTEFDSRSNVVRLIEQLTTMAAHTQQAIVCDGAVGEAAPQLKSLLFEYLEETHAKQLVVIPLTKSIDADITKPNAQRSVVVGAVAVERISQPLPLKEWRARLDRLGVHAGSAVGNAIDYEWPILAPVGRLVRRSRIVKALRNTRLSVLILTAVLTVVGLLVFYPAEFALQTPGKLQPITRHEVFAEVDGTVQRVVVRHGDVVKRGDLLAELINHDLNVTEAELLKQVRETKQEIANTERELSDSQRATAADKGKITSRRGTMVQRLRGLELQQKLMAEKRLRLRIVSPIDGRIATWNIEELLHLRPVKQGQALMTVVDPTGEWELELQVPEQRIGHILEAQRRDRHDLPISYLIASDPYQRHVAHIRDVHLSADVRDEEEGNTVLVKARLEPGVIPSLNVGGEVRAKVQCGRKPLGYVWFHEIYELLETHVFFRF